MRRIGRYVLRTYGLFLLGVLGITLTTFLVTDFVDRAKAYVGSQAVRDVAMLYGYKTLVSIHQLGSAVLLLAAGATVSLLRKRGEVTAMGSLTMGPLAIYLPIGIAALCLSLGLVLFDEWVVTDASRHVEELTVRRFNRWGDWRFYHAPKQWYRRGNHIFYLRQGDADRGFHDVTVLFLGPRFQLERRIDAESLVHQEGTQWMLHGVQERTFGKDSSHFSVQGDQPMDLGVGKEGFRVRLGRPEQMRAKEILEQVQLRKEVGLTTQQFWLALHNRVAYPLAGFPAALLAVGLALRPGRRGHLTTAMVESLGVAVLLWGLMVICRTLVLSGRMAPAIAAWAPFVVLASAALWLFARYEGLGERSG